ncbi:MAG: 2-hydroxyacyl-CoA dehydratase family protein [bacterium]|jgi:benzoyl-CoA reductase/2-hydroxyglutaryl-CoA dehydratase subunit BcrC/BadD/HgdB
MENKSDMHRESPAEGAVGITSTIPIEVVYAARRPVIDLNNVFINHIRSESLVERAERMGFPEASCAWIKGIYSAVHLEKVRTVIAVTQGDCSNTHALMETLETEGVETIPFLYPYDRDRETLAHEINKLAGALGARAGDIAAAGGRLSAIRRKVAEIDRMTWSEGTVTGFENHYFQVCCSDMNGDPDAFEAEVDEFLSRAAGREPLDRGLRLAYIGIPPIMSGIYEFIEAGGGRVVFNELQRQFSLPFDCDDIVDRYLAYTYPYHIKHRLADIVAEIDRRGVDGVIHYVQSFCFRQIEDIIVRKRLDLPVLTLEGNRPGKLDLRTKMRIEAFLDMLRYMGQGD